MRQFNVRSGFSMVAVVGLAGAASAQLIPDIPPAPSATPVYQPPAPVEKPVAAPPPPPAAPEIVLPTLTLIERDGDGKLRPVSGPPDEAAVLKVIEAFPAEKQEKIRAIIAERSARLEQQIAAAAPKAVSLYNQMQSIGSATEFNAMTAIGEQMRQISLGFVPTAILSRQVGVIRGSTLVINLPGQPKSIKETLEGVKDADGRQRVHGIFAAVPYCIDLIGGPYIETDETVVKAFRPKSAIRAKT